MPFLEESLLIQVELSAFEIPIEPGNTAQLTVTVTNKQEHDDHVSLEIEGIDVEWYALPVPTLTIPAGQSQSARVLFRLVRASDSHSGTYPFLARARSMETGESGIQQAALVVSAFSSLQIDMSPKRGVSTFFHHANVFDVSVSNLGNHEENLDLYASDPEDGCAYEYETDRVTLKPGHSETVALLIEPVTRPVLGASRLFGFTVSARSSEDSYVSASAHGQLERRALLSTLTAALILSIFLVAMAWFLFRPRPVSLQTFTAAPMQVAAGTNLTLSWVGSYLGSNSYILPGNLPVKSDVGTVIVPAPPIPGVVTYELVARGAGAEKHMKVDVTILPAPVMPKPRIREFSSSQMRIHQGDSVTLNWKVDDAGTIVLNPLNITQDPRLYRSQEVKPDVTSTYILTAKGPAGDVATKSITITVVPPNESLSVISSFKAKPEQIFTGQKSALTWSVENAMSVDIDNGVGNALPPKGRIEVSPQQTTTYTLNAADSKGILKSRQLIITVSEPPPPVIPPVQPPDNVGAPQ